MTRRSASSPTLVAVAAPVGSVPALAAALALHGLGWSFGLVSGTALPLATRAKTQGTVDLWISVAGAVGGPASGLVVATTSYATLAILGGLVAAAVVPIIAMTSLKRPPAARSIR